MWDIPQVGGNLRIKIEVFSVTFNTSIPESSNYQYLRVSHCWGPLRHQGDGLAEVSFNIETANPIPEKYSFLGFGMVWFGKRTIKPTNLTLSSKPRLWHHHRFVTLTFKVQVPTSYFQRQKLSNINIERGWYHASRANILWRSCICTTKKVELTRSQKVQRRMIFGARGFSLIIAAASSLLCLLVGK